ncbi:MAG: hypothetical protein ACI95C_000985 [Pseudohongiellaceae bacterium]|jgi:uncharacterized protein (TIGR00369 family)
MSRVTMAQMKQFLITEFPQARFSIEAFDDATITVRYQVSDADLRPGGTVSGPTMMSLADCAIYIAVLREIGLVALAVTTSLNINFLRKPAAGRDLLGVCNVLKLGKVLAIAQVSIYSEGNSEVVAHSVGTYSIPPAQRSAV